VPMRLTAGDRKILIITAAIFVVMVVAAFLLNRGTDSDAEIPTIYSTASGGSKAAYVLLKESGYRTDSWEQPLADLGEGKGKFLILAEPEGYPSKGDQQKLESFLRSGGRVLAAGRFIGFYLPDDNSTLDSPFDTTFKRVSAIGLSPITRAAPSIALIPAAHWRSEKSGTALYGDPLSPLVVQYRVGEGSVLWLASATPLTNAGLKEPGNLEFLLAAVGAPGETHILWDEYVHGYQLSTPRHATHRMLGWIALQLTICAVAVLLMYSRRSAPVWLPVTQSRLSPLEFVRTLGTLYDHARAGSVALEICYQRFRYLLARRLGVPVSTSVDDLDRAVRQRWNLQDKNFAATLRDCESYRYDPSVRPQIALQLVQELFDYAERLQLTTSSRQESRAWKRS
jgi:hypothetical protein